ncbi:hypothetical protein ANN_27454 [Periplaneta americana]|uniref:Uncharacterized protein n=1 Tax=Periplaneta americana TaxID=6978 RepID=A0ABQ8RVX2_PERAM|nr:hypothetical protein ANN_27454 [Periplaneta americana]
MVGLCEGGNEPPGSLTPSLMLADSEFQCLGTWQGYCERESVQEGTLGRYCFLARTCVQIMMGRKLSEAIRQEGNSLDLYVTGIKEECVDDNHDVTSEIKFEEIILPNNLPMVKCEAEENSCDLNLRKNELNRKIKSEEEEGSPLYMDMFDQWLMPELEANSQNFIYQQDGAPPHFHHYIREYLDARIPHHSIGHASRVDFPLLPWTLRSSNLTPCDYSSWGYVKGHAFVPPLPHDLAQLRERITHAVAGI